MISNDTAIGMRLAQMGRFAEALPHLDRANRAAPADVPTLQALARVLQMAGHPAEAIERYRIASAHSPDDVAILSGWAHLLLATGARTQAQPLLVRALELDPNYADRGGMLEKMWDTGDADAASSMLQELTERFPHHASLLCQYAETLLAGEHLDLARSAYERYRELRPRDPLACIELGKLAVNRGDFEDALRHFRDAVDIDPENVVALHEIALATDGRLDQPTLDLIQRLLQTRPESREAVSLHITLIRHHDRGGDYKAAALHAARANSLRRQLAPAQQRYSEQLHAEEIEQTIQAFTVERFERLRDAGSSQRIPVFVIGLPRSGTTLVEQMLASHPAVVGVGEQPIAHASLQRAMHHSQGPQGFLGANAVRDAADWHLAMLDDRARRLGADGPRERIIDKQPDNYLLAGWLRIAFPDAAIIHCLRDPRDVALSCWLTQFLELRWSYELDHIAHRIEQHRRLLRHWRSTIGPHLTEVRYEQLVADPQTQLRRVLAAMGLEWHPDVLDWRNRRSFVSSASRHQVRKQLHAGSIERWRNYEDALSPILPRLDAIAAQDAQETSDGMRKR